MLQDLRFAIRLLGKERWLSAVAVAALALGIGVNATVFTLVNAILIRGLPFEDSHNLSFLSWQPKHGEWAPLSFTELQEWRAQTKTFSGLAGWSYSNMNISDDRGLPEQARGMYVTANAFSVLRQQPLLGRDFGPQDETRGTDLAVILGYRVWRTRYGGDPNVVGTLTRVNGRPSVIVGVMPEGMQFPQNTDVWGVFVPTDEQQRRTARMLDVFGRVRDGVSRREAAAEIGTIGSRLITQYPQDYEEITGARVATFNDRFNGGGIEAVFMALMGAVGFVLLIACANVANLQLARSVSRAREVAVRMAMGATRWRVVRQLLIESILLGILAGILGLALASVGVRVFDASVADTGKPYWVIFKIDYVVLAFLAAVCVLTGVLFGMAPALHVSKTNVTGVLKDGGRGTTGGRRMRWLTGTMVVVEVALTIVLLVGAGLMVRSFLNLHKLELGFSTKNVMAMQLQLSGDNFKTPESRRAFYDRLHPRLAALPGAEAVALATAVPPFMNARRTLHVEGRPAPKIDDTPGVVFVQVSPPFFDVVGVSILRGRRFSDADGAPGAESVIINERLAAQYFPNEDPLGRRLKFVVPPPARGAAPAPAEPWRTIVGIVPAIRHSSPQDERPVGAIYAPFRQEASRYASVMVRSSLPASTMMDALRREVYAADRDQPVYNMRTLDQMVTRAMWPYRVFGTLFAIFALLGLLLSMVGVYAVMAYSVTQRTAEIGVRMALGAPGPRVTWMVLRRGISQLAIGMTIGLGGAYFISSVLPRELLIRIEPTDPITFVSIGMLIAVVAIAACLVPARRAMRIDPIVALRAE